MEENRAVKHHDGLDESDSEEENALYTILDPQSTLLAGPVIRNAHAPLSEDFGSSHEDSSFRNAAPLLSHQSQDVYKDVYRCVAGIDFNSQHQMAKMGERSLDAPFESWVGDRFPVGQGVREPQPRIFSRLRLEHTHLYVYCVLGEFVKTLNSVLLNNKVDYTLVESECLWRCMYYPPSPTMAVDFRIYMNSCPSLGTNRYLVEFVRRNGCALAFNSLFVAIQTRLFHQNIVTNESGKLVRSIDELPYNCCSQDTNWENQTVGSDEDSSIPRVMLLRGTSDMSSLDTQDDFDSYEMSDEDFRPLVEMSRSEFEDVHVQGLALIALECGKGHGQDLLRVDPKLVSLLVEKLQSGHPEVRRNSATALCLLAACPDLHEALINASAPRALADIAAQPYDAAVAEIARQCACALAKLSENADSIPAVFNAVQDKNDAFEKLSKSQDSRLNDSISAVRRALLAVS